MITNGTIDRLIQFDARGLPIVSAYVGLDTDTELKEHVAAGSLRLPLPPEPPG
jgi:hypothetical protein